MARKCKIEKNRKRVEVVARFEQEAASGPDGWRALDDPFPVLELEPA
jgi:hypothetical protein